MNTAPIYQSRSGEIEEALIENVISKYCVLMDLDSAFMLTLMKYLLKKFGIKTVAPYNHQSLQMEHGMKSLSNILTEHLTDHGQMWHKYLPLATLAYNTFNSPNLCYIKFFQYVQFIVISNNTKTMTPRIPPAIAKVLCNILDISNFHKYANV